MYRTHNCGELRLLNVGKVVTLAGWAAKVRLMGSMAFIDLRDRYGVTQLTFNESISKDILEQASAIGREFVLQITGTVTERSSKNSNLGTGDIEIVVNELKILNASQTPPFTIEEDTDGGDELRMQYRYLDLRRDAVRKNLELRHQLAKTVRNYLDNEGFIEVETPVLIKSTPEGARDFVVPSRMNPGEFYALPQSPQTFKQLLMVGGLDKYYQIVKCFRDEDLRADRQPEFTQIDCEMSFVERDDVMQIFEGMVKAIFEKVLHVDLAEIQQITYQEAMRLYGSDKPDLRFDMHFHDFSGIAKGKGFGVFDNAETVLGICATGAGAYTRKQLDELTEFVKRPQIGATGLIWCRVEEDGSMRSSVDKYFDAEALAEFKAICKAKPGDLILLMAGSIDKTRSQLCELRLEMANQLGLRNPKVFKPLWVLDFPLLERDEINQRWHAMHHPFTSPLVEDIDKMMASPGEVRANAYDFVINGVEVGGGSIRIFNRELQENMFSLLGFTKEEAQNRFGFLMKAFEYGAPPHGGIAFGFDRLCSLLGGSDSIRDFIAFPKNNAGRDVMIDAPSAIDESQLKELRINYAYIEMVSDLLNQKEKAKALIFLKKYFKYLFDKSNNIENDRYVKLTENTLRLNKISEELIIMLNTDFQISQNSKFDFISSKSGDRYIFKRIPVLSSQTRISTSFDFEKVVFLYYDNNLNKIRVYESSKEDVLSFNNLRKSRNIIKSGMKIVDKITITISDIEERKLNGKDKTKEYLDIG